MCPFEVLSGKSRTDSSRTQIVVAEQLWHGADVARHGPMRKEADRLDDVAHAAAQRVNRQKGGVRAIDAAWWQSPRLAAAARLFRLLHNQHPILTLTKSENRISELALHVRMRATSRAPSRRRLLYDRPPSKPMPSGCIYL